MSQAPSDADPRVPPAGAPGQGGQAGVSQPPGPGWTQYAPPTPSEPHEKRRSWIAASPARGIALFIGGFTLVNSVGLLRGAAFDANVWWIAVPYVPSLVAAILLAAVGVAFVAYGVAPRMSAWRRWLTLALFAVFAAVAVYDAVDFYRVWSAGRISPGVPVPLSAVVAVLLGYLLWAALRDPAPRGWPAVVVLCAAAAACTLAFPVAQVFFFGTTDYRRPADVAVVFGAQVRGDGKPSTALNERMATAEQLYKDGLVKRLLVSGGVGDSGYNEALVMRDMAVKAGVPAKDVVVDSNGVNTDATVRDTVPFFGGKGWDRILAVSQYYHLPRVKLAYAGAGWDVLTVPAPATERTTPMVVREIPAFWVYYLRAIFG
jgi:vancomycin permeability regulator SanA